MYGKEEILRMIADQLDLSETELDNVIRSYKAVGELLNNNLDVKKYGNVKIFPQGSVALGTVVKPILEKDYDVDMVCKFNDISMPLEEVKGLVGKVLKSSERYATMLKLEGKRCWTLKYENYHMDILPAKSNISPITAFGEPSIIATHREYPGCPFTKIDTNPRGYLKWFLQRCDSNLSESKTHFEVESPRDYVRKSILQKTVQLLKRHRDLYFSKNNFYGVDNAPISIIITTLAGLSYNGETSLLDSLINVSTKMSSFIKFDNGNPVIKNPVDSRENFADKWKNKIKLDAFNDWMKVLKDDLQKIKSLETNECSKFMETIFGKESVNRVFDSIGKEIKTLRENGNLKFTKDGKISSVVGSTIINHTFYGK